MAQTTFALILYFHIVAHKTACHTLFFEIYGDMVQILLILKALSTQDSEVEDMFCGASLGSETCLFFNYKLGV